MRYIIVFTGLLFVLFSCTMSMNDQLPDFGSLKEAQDWINKNIEYKSDQENYGYSEYWASPEQVLNKKSGDCEDMAILLLYIAKTQFNYEGKLVSINLRYCNSFHAITYIESQYYDPCWDFIGWNCGYGIGQKTYDYYTVMSMAFSNYKW